MEAVSEGNKANILGGVGIANLGNTCYLNSVIQCFSHTSALRKYFLSGDFTQNRTNDKIGQLSIEFANILTELWKAKQDSKSTETQDPSKKFITPTSLHETITLLAPQFNGQHQNDAAELMGYFLDSLHEDLKSPASPILTEPNNDPELTQSLAAWQDHLSRQQTSKILDLFHGQFETILTCCTCSHQSFKFDPFVFLSLPVPTRNEIRLEVTFVPSLSKQSLIPTKYGIKVPKLGKVKDIRDVFSKINQLDLNSLFLCEARGGRIWNVFPLDQSVKDITSLSPETLFIFEVLPENKETKPAILPPPGPSQPGGPPMPPTTLPPGLPPVGGPPPPGGPPGAFSGKLPEWTKVVFRFLDQKGEYQLFGFPFLLPLRHTPPSDEKFKNSDLYREILKLMKSIIPDNIDVVLNDFEFSIVGRTGKTCGNCAVKTKCSGCRVNNDANSLSGISDKTTLSIDFKDPQHPFCDFYTKLKPEEDESYQRTKKEEEISLNDCLETFSSIEVLDEDNGWHCPTCNLKRQATKVMKLWKLPEYLFVHLKRFPPFMQSWKDKYDMLIDFPLDLNLSSFAPKNVSQAVNYDLYAVCNHTTEQGIAHYTSHAKNFVDGEWYYYNDTLCLRSSPDNAVSNQAYILCYKRK